VAADIAKAHRRFKHAEEDHGYLCCRAREGGPIWVNRVGTFGVACAAYHFSRLAGLVGRATVRVLRDDPFFQFLFADELQLQAGGSEKYVVVWRALLFWLMTGAPFKWSKFRGGVQLEYVGFAFDFFKFTFGLSERRSGWICKFVEEAEKSRGMIEHRRFIEFVGRLVYASQVLYWVKPFMGVLHRWKGALQPGTVAKTPKMVQMILRFISKLLAEGHGQVSSMAPPSSEREAFRTDAKAEKDFFVLGGWETWETSDPKDARWFSLRVSAEELPCLFKEGKHARGMSTVAELLATLVGLQVFGWTKVRNRLFTVSAGTDNLANEHLSFRDATTRFPLSYVHMQVSLDMYRSGGFLQLRWRPRDLNQPADDLTNDDFRLFDPAKRVPVSLEDLDLSFLLQMSAFHSELAEWVPVKTKGPKMSKKAKMDSRTRWE
jgi:hypothetical protein